MSEHPQIYDIKIDEWRDVTQEDVDRLEKAAKHLGRITAGMFKMHNEFRAEMGLPLIVKPEA